MLENKTVKPLTGGAAGGGGAVGAVGALGAAGAGGAAGAAGGAAAAGTDTVLFLSLFMESPLVGRFLRFFFSSVMLRWIALVFCRSWFT